MPDPFLDAQRGPWRTSACHNTAFHHWTSVGDLNGAYWVQGFDLRRGLRKSGAGQDSVWDSLRDDPPGTLSAQPVIKAIANNGHLRRPFGSRSHCLRKDRSIAGASATRRTKDHYIDPIGSCLSLGIQLGWLHNSALYRLSTVSF